MTRIIWDGQEEHGILITEEVFPASRTINIDISKAEGMESGDNGKTLKVYVHSTQDSKMVRKVTKRKEVEQHIGIGDIPVRVEGIGSHELFDGFPVDELFEPGDDDIEGNNNNH